MNWKKHLMDKFCVEIERSGMSAERLTEFENFISTEIIEKLIEDIEEVHPNQFCSMHCAVQAPSEDFGHMGCTCGGEEQANQYNFDVSNIKQQLRKEWL